MQQAVCGLCVALTSSWYTKEVPGATRPSSSCILGLLLPCCCRPLLLLLLLLLPPQHPTKQPCLGKQEAIQQATVLDPAWLQLCTSQDAVARKLKHQGQGWQKKTSRSSG